jgi:aspartyl-tRNA(Asn)/glutamyl-tRNA(Gln) amidotransferase subunit B
VKLRSILQYLGVSTGNMEEGSFRCDANISLLPEGSQKFTPKVEVKNMNSFKAVYLAMEYEARRQRKAADEGTKLVQETRGWLDEKGKTVSQRSKEYAHDYRYFPEPDLPPLVISRDWVEEVRKKLPELPEARRDRFMTQYDLPLYDAGLLTGSKAMAEYFEESVNDGKEIAPKEISNWLLGEVSRIVNAGNIDIEGFRKQVSPPALAGLILSAHGVINAATAKTVLEEMFRSGKSAAAIIRERGLSQISDTSELEKIAAEVIHSNTQAVADYQAGKETAVKFLVGQVMKATKGRANPQLVNEVLKQKLAEALNKAGGE